MRWRWRWSEWKTVSALDMGPLSSSLRTPTATMPINGIYPSAAFHHVSDEPFDRTKFRLNLFSCVIFLCCAFLCYFFFVFRCLLFPLAAATHFTHMYIARWLDVCTQKGNTSTRHFTHLIQFIHVDWLSVRASERASDSRLKHFTLYILLLVGNRGGGGGGGGDSDGSCRVCLLVLLQLFAWCDERWIVSSVCCVRCVYRKFPLNKSRQRIYKIHKRICWEPNMCRVSIDCQRK